MRTVAALIAATIAASGCAAPDSAPVASADCVDDTLAAYRSLAAPAGDVFRAYGSVVRATAKLPFSAPVRGMRPTVGEILDPPADDLPAKLRPLLRGVRKGFREARAATGVYAHATRNAARVAAACAEDGDVADPECRAALADLATVLRDTGESVKRSLRELRTQKLNAALERLGLDLEQRQARLEGAAAGAAQCAG